MRHYTSHHIRKVSEEYGIPVRLAFWHRKRCLQTALDKMMESFDHQEDPILVHWMAQDIKKVKAEMLKLSEEIERIDRKFTPEQITDDMIERARNYPIERLVDFDRTGKSIAFCHADKTPSLSWWKKGNKATCFPCNKRFDTISLLMERDNFTFAEAVKRLQ